MTEFNIELPNCWDDSKSLRVIADISPAESDVGIKGNGKIVVNVEEVYCTEEGFDPQEDIYSVVEDRIDDIAHLIYQNFYGD